MNPIAVIPKCTTHWFWRAAEGGAREAAKEAGAEIIWKGSLKEDDPTQQIQIFEQFVAEGADGIVLAPIDDAALKRPVAAAMQKGIPVVIMDSAFKGQPLKDFVCYGIDQQPPRWRTGWRAVGKAFTRQRQGGALSLYRSLR